LLVPQSGDVEFNGQLLQNNLEEWRSQVAYLPQQVFLIDNSLRGNVALGEEESEIDEIRLREALRQARLSELVEQLPQGVDTILGERGVRLSGGQRQRIALARAFYHGRSVLVMDEATSALDNETEKEIIAEIQRLKGKKTMIVIAHRLTTVQHCDRIYRLEQGKIVEEGTPEQVLKKAS
jgi:ABC-type multidrug transport system fused ATPase/permease subunit